MIYNNVWIRTCIHFFDRFSLIVWKNWLIIAKKIKQNEQLLFLNLVTNNLKYRGFKVFMFYFPQSGSGTTGYARVLILDGSSELLGAHVGSNYFLFYLFRAFDSIESRHNSNFFCLYMHAQHVLGYTGHGGMKENFNNAEHFNLFLPPDPWYRKNKV